MVSKVNVGMSQKNVTDAADDGSSSHHPIPLPDDASTSPTCCCCCRRHPKVNPFPGSYPGYKMVEIRRNRCLRIVHLNAAPRPPDFEDDYFGYLKRQKRRHEIRRTRKQILMSRSSIRSSQHLQDHLDKHSMPEPMSPKRFITPRVEVESCMSNSALPNNTNQNANPSDSVRQMESPRYSNDQSHPNATQTYRQSSNSAQQASPLIPNKVSYSDYDHVFEPSHDIANESKLDHSDPYRGSHIANASGIDMGHPNSIIGNPDPVVSPMKVSNASPEKEATISRHNTAVTLTRVSLHVRERTALSDEGSEYTVGSNGAISRESTYHHADVPDAEWDKMVLFFLHGVGGSSDVWRTQLDYFEAEGYECIAIDLLGHGFSAAPDSAKDYEFKEMSLDVMGIFDLYCKRRNTIIGHSYGCSFAAVIARKRARFVHKLIFISGGSPTPLAPQPGIFSLPLCILTCCQHVVSRGFKRSAFHQKGPNQVDQKKAFDVPPYVLRHTMNGQNWLEGDFEYHSMISVPTLLLHGREDRLVTVQEESEMHRAIYSSRLEVVDGASHMVMMESPIITNSLLHKFIIHGLSFSGGSMHPSPNPTPVVPSSGDQQDVPHRDNKNRRSSRAMGSTLSLRSVKSIPANLVVSNIR